MSGVELKSSEYQNTRLTGVRTAKAFELAINRQNGRVTAQGPGTLVDWRRGNGKLGFAIVEYISQLGQGVRQRKGHGNTAREPDPALHGGISEAGRNHKYHAGFVQIRFLT
jgi:hypothetical protein